MGRRELETTLAIRIGVQRRLFRGELRPPVVGLLEGQVPRAVRGAMAMHFYCFVRKYFPFLAGVSLITVYPRRSSGQLALVCALAPAASAIVVFHASLALAHQADTSKPVVVQPGAPGQPSKTLPPSTRATLPPRSPADVEFMQGMIMHHAQAIEMTALIPSRSENKGLRSLGARISSSQDDEIKFMKRWLTGRGEPESMHDAMHPTHD